MGVKIVFVSLLLLFFGGAFVMFSGAACGVSPDAQLPAGLVTMVSGMLVGLPLGNIVQLRRFPYLAEPKLTKLTLPDDVPEPARRWIVTRRDAVAALGYELLEAVRIDRGSYTFACLMEHPETRTLALMTWHGRARTIAFETAIGTRRHVTLSSDSTIDLPLPDDVDVIELWSLAPAAILQVHRTLVSRNGDLDPSSYRATPSAARSDPIGWFRERETRSLETFLATGIASVIGQRMRFTWSGAMRAVFSTAVPLNVIRAVVRVRRTTKLLDELGIARTSQTSERSAPPARPLLYVVVGLFVALVLWTLIR